MFIQNQVIPFKNEQCRFYSSSEPGCENQSREYPFNGEMECQYFLEQLLLIQATNIVSMKSSTL